MVRSVYEYKSCSAIISLTSDSVTLSLYCVFSATKCFINVSSGLRYLFFLFISNWHCAVRAALLKCKQHTLSLHKNTVQAHHTPQLVFKVTSTSDSLIAYPNMVIPFYFNKGAGNYKDSKLMWAETGTWNMYSLLTEEAEQTTDWYCKTIQHY